MKYLATYNIAREFARTRSFKTEALAMAFIDATAEQCFRDNETFEHEIKMFEDDKTPAQLNAQIAQRLTEATPYNDGAPVFAKVDRSFYRVQLKNVATMAAKIKSAHRTFPAGAYKRMGSGRDYPVFYPGMTTKEYIVKFQSLNSNGYSYTKTGLAHVLPIDFDRLGDRPAALYENGALDFDAIEEPNEEYFSDAAAQDVAEVVAQALATIAITEAMAPTEDAHELVTCEAGESEASAPTAGRTSWAPVPQYVPPSLSQIKPGEPVPPAFRGGMDDINPPSGGNAEPTPRPVESTDFSGDIPLSLAVSAFGGVSMSPDRRGLSAKNEYGQSMAADYETLRAQAVKGGTLDLLPEVFARYRARQASAYRAYLSSSSRCVSSFIAGPANFPVARMQKRNDIAHKRLNEYLDGGKMALQSAIRTLRPDLRAIMSGDADAIDRLTIEIEAAERLQNQMKACNKAIRATAKMDEAHKVAALMEIGYSETQAVEILNPPAHYGRGPGFPSYRLTNNQANIRRMRARLEQITAAKARPVESVECANGVTLEDDAPANRVRLFFPGKPAEAIRDELKASGFRWAPSVGAWQAYRNYGTLATAKRMAGEPVKAEENAQDAAPEAEIVAEVEIVAPSPVMESAEAPMAPVAEVLTGEQITAKSIWTAGQRVCGVYCGTPYAGFIADSRQTPDGRNVIFTVSLDSEISIYGQQRARIEVFTNERSNSIFYAPTPPAVESQPVAVAPAVEAAQDVPADNVNEWGPAIGETYIGAVEYAVQEANKRGDGFEYRTGENALMERRKLPAVTQASAATQTAPAAPTTPVATSTPGTPVAVSSAPLHPRRFVPDNGLHYVEDAFEAWTFQHKKSGRYCFVMYLGRQSKSHAHYGYPTEAKRDEGFLRHVAEVREMAALKAKRKAESKAQADKPHGLQVGDVVRSSWGYDQTNVNHYQVTAVIGKRTVEVRELNEHHESTGDMTGRASPVWGDFAGEPMRRQVDKHGQVNMLLASYGRASKIEPLAIVHGVRCYAATSYSSYA